MVANVAVIYDLASVAIRRIVVCDDDNQYVKTTGPCQCQAGEICLPVAVSTYQASTMAQLQALIAADAAKQIGVTSSYQTNFPLAENPILEGGRWQNNGKDWNNVQTVKGKAMGTILVPVGYADSYAYAAGYGNDHTVEATIFEDGAATYSDSHECGLHLRKSDSAHVSQGYECNFPYGGGPQIVRWNGAIGDFGLVATTGPGYASPFVTGDIIKASILGPTITLWVNGAQVLQGTDATFATGNPGFGFFARADTYAQYCFTHLRISSP